MGFSQMITGQKMIPKLYRKCLPDCTTKDPVGTINDAQILPQIIPRFFFIEICFYRVT